VGACGKSYLGVQVRNTRGINGRLFEGSTHVNGALNGADLINQGPLCNALRFGRTLGSLGGRSGGILGLQTPPCTTTEPIIMDVEVECEKTQIELNHVAQSHIKA
jgi:hypothetical protein